MDKEEGTLEALGVKRYSLGRSERNLLSVIEEAVEYYREYPQELSKLKRAREELKISSINLRINSIPPAFHQAVSMMDLNGVKRPNRAMINILILLIDCIIEDVNGDK